jgi:hypothetical protein
MSEGVEFVVRLVNQATGPAGQIKKSVQDVTKAVTDAKRSLEAPAPRRSPLSDWDKMVSRAKLSQRADFARSLKPAAPPKVVEDKNGFLATLGGVVSGNMITGALRAIGDAAIGAVVEVTKIGVAFVETALHAAAFSESSVKAIGYLTDNAAHAGTVFNDVRRLAQSLGLEVESTVEGFQKLLAAQFTVSQAKGLVKMSADMRAIGASAEEVKRIIYAMTEIKSMGTLQKRQERMLQMAGISGELIDKALMARTGIKTKGGIDLARKKNLIDADTAIEAIKDAVMHKTHEGSLGEVAANRAKNTLTGMLDTLKAGVENFWIDVGEKMQPGATRVAKLIAGTLGKIADDPKVSELGEFLLAKWEKFTNFLQAKWPQIESAVIGGLHTVADAIKSTANVIENSQGPLIVFTALLAGAAGIAGVLAVALGALATVAFVAAAGVMLIGGALGFGLAFLVDHAIKWYNSGKNLTANLVAGILSGLGPLGNAISMITAALALKLAPVAPAPAVPGSNPVATLTAPIKGTAEKPLQLAPDPEVLLSSLATGNINGVNIDNVFKKVPDKTEAGKPAASHSVNVGEMILNVTSSAGDDPNATGAKIGAAVRAELQKFLKG